MAGVYYFRWQTHFYCMRIRLSVVCTLMLASILHACQDGPVSQSKGPIRMGDPLTIVTEPDSQYLQDYVLDIQTPNANPVADTAIPPVATPPVADTPTPTRQAPEEQGLTITFPEVTLLIPDVTTKTYSAPSTNDATYELRSGTLNGNRIKVTKGTVTKISQRYQTVIVAKNEMGKLVLDGLTTTTSWASLKGSGGTYTISGLEPSNLAYVKANSGAIRSAVTKAARGKRLSRTSEQKWLKSVAKTRAANQPPLTVVLRSVMWRIDGKDAKGKSFSKQVRMDIPL